MEITLSERRLKEMAKTLRAGLPETARPTYTQTLDLLASVFGQRTFAALKAQIEPAAETQPPAGNADSRPFTVIVSDDRDNDLVYQNSTTSAPSRAAMQLGWW
ncbi:hypothetical protein CKO28_00635 [Rhodovibrio sodomensis]|uniref:Uncharacterized protein n=1 Tax=Rhodovibrio sodomensis TaxID=1088 RepID=A0ABS1D9A2_9PROT|nr:hypothetical protein [Rhodovibrio sodomensis]MBK1666547.1 hypothetical protein [Rhodovibrio sodomensis]